MGNGGSGQTKTWHANAYLALYSLAGIGLAAIFTYDFIREYPPDANVVQDMLKYAVLVAMLAICRSYPLPTRQGEYTDISIILLYAITVVYDVRVTVLAIVISAFFEFEKRNGKTVSAVLNTHISKVLFNNANYIISVSAGWLVFSLVNTQAPGDLSMPGLLLPSILFLLVTLLVNSISTITVLKLTTGIPFFSSLLGVVTSLLPTLMAFAPIGYFLAYIFVIPETGPWLVALFFVPLMFARYAFKLYIDSKEQYIRTISTLTAAIEAKDEYTEGHSKRVSQYSVEIAQAMGMSQARLENIKVAAVLHDIGKIGIEDVILRKPTKLSPEEWEKIVQHPAIGVKILEEVAIPAPVRDMILYHHVRFDGGGYPTLDPEKKVAMEVHVISLADAYDAMTSDRPYRKALSEETAMGIIRQERGTQFHPEVVDTFLKMKQKSVRAAQ